jgi:electron transfer flavoprotein beta subunit
VTVERVAADGIEVIEAPLPALITVTNEYGEPRYPTMRGIMAARRTQPEIFSVAELGLASEDLAPQLKLVGLYRPETKGQVEFIDGDDDETRGRNLVLRLREENLI